MTTVTKTSSRKRPLSVAIAELKKYTGQAGWFASSKYPDGTYVAYIAAIQEFGSPEQNIPPRMGLRNMLENKNKDWTKFLRYAAKRVLNETAEAREMMEVLGSLAQADIFKQIKSVTEPPLAKATLAARARRHGGQALTATGAKILNDTGTMIATVTHIVSEASETNKLDVLHTPGG